MGVQLPQEHFWAELPFTGQAPSTARRQLRLFARDLAASIIDDASVMVSELVTNAVQHGRPEIMLQLWRRPERVTVAVTDLGEGSVSLMHLVPAGDQLRGRGLVIVNALARRWGVRCCDGGVGKTVWFDLATA
jgi:anti-sigma regulatory factor (Ser/Thr protein kinase)